MKVAIDAAFGEGTAEEMRLLSYTIANYGKEEIKALAKDFKTKSAQAPQRRHMD